MRALHRTIWQGMLVAGLFGAATIGFAADPKPTPAAAARPTTDGLQLWLDAAKLAADGKLRNGDPVTTWTDSSPARRDLRSTAGVRAPTLVDDLVRGVKTPVVRFDGADDFLERRDVGQKFREATLFVVAAPHSNAGWFRCLFSANRQGKNDYVTGLNLDQGGGMQDRFRWLNAEGAGFIGDRDLMTSESRFGAFRVIALRVAVGKQGVALWINGQPQQSRDRDASEIVVDELRVGARHYSNTAEPAQPRDVFHGDIAEVLFYGRALPDNERQQVEAYLAAKHAALLKLPGLPPVNPFKMLAPGFTVRELPLELSNINDALFTPDGRLFLLGYDGRIHIARDTDGDGLEDKATLFWDRPTLKSPIGMVLAPEGLYVTSVGKISLFKDRDHDGRADEEEVVFSKWDKPENYSGGVDALGLARGSDGALYFALGCSDFTNAYIVKNGQAHYRLDSDRGTILRLSPDRRTKEIVCTGVRFGVSLAFNRQGDLFATDQEGETWLPGGNPLDELLHIEKGKHYGFPPRHEKWLPNVVDAPAAVEFGPQHQSTCGLIFNEPVADGGKHFGPAFWRGDAIVAGYSRGKLWRVPLVKGDRGYTGRPILFASINMLTLDTAIDPAGNLLVLCHSGPPDWGSGPSGMGRLFKIVHTNPAAPQARKADRADSFHTTIQFDKPVDPAVIKLVVGQELRYGNYVRAGDAHEKMRPGYAVVDMQQRAHRGTLRITAASLDSSGQMLTLRHDPHPARAWYAVAIPGVRAAGSDGVGETVEVDYELTDSSLPTIPDPPLAQVAAAALPANLAGGSRARGEAVFFGDKARCSACHLLRGKGAKIGPDLSNLVHRDAVSVVRDILQPSATINPDYVPYKVQLADGQNLAGLVRTEGADRLRIFDTQAKEHVVAAADVERMEPGQVSIMPADIEKSISPRELKDLIAFLLSPPPEMPIGVAPPPPRSRKVVDAALRTVAATPPSTPSTPLNILLVWGIKDHGPGEHDYPRWHREWSQLLAQAPGANVRSIQDWPDDALFAWAHTIIFFHMHQNFNDARYKQLDAYQARGGGLISLHSAVIPKAEPEKFAARHGLAWNWGKTKFRHGPLDLTFTGAHPITRGMPSTIKLIDETYWPMFADAKGTATLATTVEDGKPQPMLWTAERGKGRVFGSILGHYYWTFDDPLFRIILLRGIAWTANQPIDRLQSLATDGVQMTE